ncbi:MAG: beta-glucosidase [Christensenellales bacterium]
MKYKELIDQMTLEEKAGMCSGLDMWHTKPIERLGIPSIMTTDGPHGLRKQGNGDSVHKSVAATCFPTASCCAATWNRELVEEMGKAIGEEALQEKVGVVLGPGVNIKRTSICGRNFEYYSEDPLLAGKMAASFIKGVQSKGIGTSLKHYFANNQETRRMTVSAEADERALREIYLRPFEYAVKEGKPKTMMCSYNKINGVYACENKKYLNDVLREEWGYQGIVMSDWGATNDRPKGVDAGLELEMPGSGGYNDALIVQAVKDGKLSEEVLDRAVDRMLDLVFSTPDFSTNYQYDAQAHDALSAQIAAEGAVLLENKGEALPLSADENILIVGEMAKKPRYQGAGSSHICPTKLTSFIDVLEQKGVRYEYARGYKINKSGKIYPGLIDQAVEKAKGKDKVIVFAGLTDSYEAEGFDRKNIDMPIAHLQLIDALANSGAKVIVVLAAGSAIAIPFKDKVKAVLMMHLGGQNVGNATYDLLFGNKVPCGKLAETYPMELQDIPSYNDMTGDFVKTQYRESIYVGYRYFDTAGKQVAYPFGYGLSYTDFEYSDLKVNNAFEKEGIVKVSFNVRNIGKYDAKEIVQVYVHRRNDNIFVPNKELKAFDKVFVKAGDSVRVELQLDKDAFSSFITAKDSFDVVGSDYDVIVAASSADERLKETIHIDGETYEQYAADKQSLAWYYKPQGNVIPQEQFETLIGRKIDDEVRVPIKGEFTADNTFEEMQQTSKFAGVFIKLIKFGMQIASGCASDDPGLVMMVETMRYSRVRNVSYTSQGALNPYMAEGLVMMCNGHFFKGLFKLLKNIARKAQ